jgi:hypothetical protein
VLEIKTIGETAGLVWNFLRSNGDTSLTALEKGIEAPKTIVSMAVGWLAREGKIDLRDDRRAVRVSLRESD